MHEYSSLAVSAGTTVGGLRWALERDEISIDGGGGRCMRDELAALRKESEEKRFPADPSGIVIRVSR